MKTIEDLYDDLGGLGRFQFLVVMCVYNIKAMCGWSMLLVSYAFLVPDYNCITRSGSLSGNVEQSFRNDSVNVCMVNSTECKDYEFLTAQRTVITEWGLICDLKWVKSVITSVQMTGVLVGALLAGQLGDFIGRKKTTYGFSLFHVIVNVVAAFSVSWQMFVISRFVIGIGLGGMLVVISPYPIEFLPLRWRGGVVVLPSWALGVAAFALAAYLTEDWAILHLLCAAISSITLLGYFVVPESVRWLTVRGRLEEAHKVLEYIARINKEVMPSYSKEVLRAIAKEEEEMQKSGKKYHYLDILRHRRMAWTTFVFMFLWMTLSVVTYGLSFGVSSLAGNVYVNIFLMAVIEIPGNTVSFYFVNKFGRRATCIAGMILSAAAGFACLGVSLTMSGGDKGLIINVLSLTAKMGIGISWLNSQTWIIEKYPTVTRYLGYGAANAAARIGGIISPFVVNLEDFMVGSYAVIGVFSLISACLLCSISETKDALLPETFKQSTNPSELEVSVNDHHELLKVDNTAVKAENANACI